MRNLRSVFDLGNGTSAAATAFKNAGIEEWIREIEQGDYEFELERRTKLVAELETARKLLPGRKVRIAAPPATINGKLSDLPATIQLSPGDLHIVFHGTEDLLRQMFELSQAIMNDLRKFEEICEASPEGSKKSRHVDIQKSGQSRYPPQE